jgi:hypothetical protein
VNYTDNYNLRKPELTDPVDIDDLNYNADEIDSLLKGLADGLDGITPEGIGAETPTGAQQKANQAETNAKDYADIVADAIDTLINELDDGKVDKEVGKVLSTNDYTTDEKNKLAGIEAGAEVNNISDEDANELTGGEETNLHKHAAADVNITDAGGYYDSTDVEGVLQEVGSELVTHKADTMPHKFEDLKNTVTYKFGFQLSAEGNPQIIFEEVV